MTPTPASCKFNEFNNRYMRYCCTELTNLDTNADLFAMMNDYGSRGGDGFIWQIGSGRRSDFLGVVIFPDKASLTTMTTPDIPIDV